MKIPLWCLVVLLACVFSPGNSDCQGECVACGLLLQRQQLQQAFNTMVCLLECEGHVSSSLTWEVCKRAVPLSQHPAFPDGALLFKRAGEEVKLTSLDLSTDREGVLGEGSLQYDSSLLESSEQREEEERELRDVESDSQLEGDDDEGSRAVTLSKRFGGFQRGRHNYRKLISSPMRSLQKRYGGFIGVRKSARKWNSQKRVNQLLRQYLGMRSSRSGRFNNSPITRVWRQDPLEPVPL